MTVIATDGRTMSGDGQVTTEGGRITSRRMRKVRRLANGCLVGVAGVPYAMDPFCRWLEEGGDFPELEKDEFEPLVVDRRGRCWTYDHRGNRTEETLPACVGSGGEMALGAMLAGKSPTEAVRLTCDHHAECGGRVTTVRRG